MALENIPVWAEQLINERNSDNYVQQRNQRQAYSLIVDHLITTCKAVNRSATSTVLYTHSNPRVLKFTEATANASEKLYLCKQKAQIKLLRLPLGNNECVVRNREKHVLISDK